MKLEHLKHLTRICNILVKYGLDDITLTPSDLPHADWLRQQAYLTGRPAKSHIRLFWPLKIYRYLTPWNWKRRLSEPLNVRIRLALEDLGPLFVKFGQMLSTRPDLFPADIIKEISKLQDNVPPFCGETAKQATADALGKPLDDVFNHFDTKPLASASISQVHPAQLKTGEAVIVKVLRPKILTIIERDLTLLRWLARRIEKRSHISEQLKPLAIVDEYEKTILNELDLMREAANAMELKRNFSDSDLLYVPQVHWDHCRGNILVMERINGIPINDITQLQDHKIQLKALAERGVEIFFTQVFKYNFFHADMHPGNVFVCKEPKEHPKYMAIDFGIMGSLHASDKRYIAENLLAFFKRDYYKVAELHIQSGWVEPNTPVDEFAATIRTVCEPIFQKPLNEISFGKLLIKLLQTARQYKMEVQPQLMLLQKTLLQIEGLGRQLYPELNLWSTALPFLENWVREQANPLNALSAMKDKLPYIVEQLPNLPEKLLNNVKKPLEAKKKQQTAIEKITTQLSKTIWLTILALTLSSAALLITTITLINHTL